MDSMYHNITDKENSSTLMTDIPESSQVPLALTRYILEVGISLPVAVIGLVGNIVAFMVLQKQKQGPTTKKVLQFLSITDTLLLLLTILLRSLRYCHIQHGGLEHYMKIYAQIFAHMYPCVYIFRLVDTWLTVLLTVDRYIAVCYPLHAKHMCTLKRTYIYIALLITLSLLFSLSRFFEFQCIDQFRCVWTDLVKNKIYTIVYRIILFFLFMYLIPMALLIILNTRLLRALWLAEHNRVNMHHHMVSSQNHSIVENDTTVHSLSHSHTSNHTNVNSPNHTSKHSRVSSSSYSITAVVVAVVLVSVLCNSTAMLAHLLWSLQECYSHMNYLDIPRRYMSLVGNTMVTLNSAANFFIYCVCSHNFRESLLQFRCCQSPAGVRLGRGTSK